MSPPSAGARVEKCLHYPPPLASHHDVVNNSFVFWDTLRKFHFSMGTKFMIPVIGGKELDLHVLYVEVTKRGGYEKVVGEKKWREVGSAFKLSPTTTSASYVLRKHYFSLLYHYEQLYLFKMQASMPTNFDGAFGCSKNSCSNEMAIVEYSAEGLRDCPDVPVDNDPSCFSAMGTIDGKFDCGYLVSVKLGSETLSGVLYHPDQTGFSSSTPQHSNALVPSTHSHRYRHSRRRKRLRGGGDPGYPKPNRSGYNFYFAEKHMKLKSVYPNREREFTKMIGESWSNLSAEERKVYQNIGLKDKERYKRELKEYKEKVKQMQIAHGT